MKILLTFNVFTRLNKMKTHIVILIKNRYIFLIVNVIKKVELNVVQFRYFQSCEIISTIYDSISKYLYSLLTLMIELLFSFILLLNKSSYVLL